MKQIFGYFLLIGLSLVGGGCKRDKAPAPVAPQQQAAPKPVYEYGFNLLEYKVVKDTLRAGDTFGALLNTHGVPADKVAQIAALSKELIQPRSFKAGQPYALIFDKKLQRTIVVDIRYMLWVIDVYSGAKHIVDELNIIQ